MELPDYIIAGCLGCNAHITLNGEQVAASPVILYGEGNRYRCALILCDDCCELDDAVSAAGLKFNLDAFGLAMRRYIAECESDPTIEGKALYVSIYRSCLAMATNKDRGAFDEALADTKRMMK